MSKKNSTWDFLDGLIVGSGFFLGYFITKWLVAFALIFGVVYVTCNYVEKQENKGKQSQIVNRLVDSYSTELVFDRNCAVRSEPEDDAKYLGRIKPGEKYVLLRKEGQWRKLFKTGWTKCVPSSKNSSEPTLKKN